MIFHLAERAAWTEAEGTRVYRAPSLSTEGFIHASTAAQVLATAARFYAGRTDLVLLAIDEGALSAEVRYEAPVANGAVETDRAGQFPHVYGPIETAAVRWIAPLELGPDGFVVPPALEAFLTS